MKTLEFKSFDLIEHKADDSGNLIITGYGAVFGNIDSYKDIIQMGAFADTINERKERIAFCYQHDIFNPIGKIQEIKEDPTGLYIRVMISAAESDIQTKIKEGILKEMSIGYRVIESREEIRDEVQIRLLTKISLFEISLVTIAANPMAMIEGMKSEAERTDLLEKEFNRLIAIVKNENVNFEIRKLKEIALSALAQQTVPQIEAEPEKKELKASIFLESNFFTNNLKN
jgi:HK97 family phage prohead protease